MAHNMHTLAELADQVAASATAISQYLRSKSLEQPTFHPSYKGLPDDPEIQNAKHTLLVASRALSILSHNPLSHVREVTQQFNECSALLVIVEFRVAHILPLDGKPMHISELAKRSGAEEYKLISALRILATQYIFIEVEPNYFAHNSCSVYLAEQGTEALVSHCLDPLVQGSIKVPEAMRKYPGSADPREAGFGIGNSTNLTFFEWLTARPAKMERFNNCLKSVAQGSYQRLQTVYPWHRLGKAKVVDLGGGNGHVSYKIARAAPDLEFVIQDLAQTVSEAARDCPEDLRHRFEFQVVDFMEVQKQQADAYFMRLILHFLNDEDCVKVIRNLVPAMKKGSRILIAESIVPECKPLPNPMHRYVFCQNWNMITLLNAKERTFEEFAELFRKADPRFRMKQWGEAGGPPSSEIIEATLAIEELNGNRAETKQPIPRHTFRPKL